MYSTDLNPGGFTPRDLAMMSFDGSPDYMSTGTDPTMRKKTVRIIYDPEVWSDPSRRPDKWTNYDPDRKEDEGESPAVPEKKEDPPTDDDDAFPF